MRSITFTIPANSGKSGHAIVVTLSEQSDGSILFNLEATGGNHVTLAGLFFDVNTTALLNNLTVTGGDILSSTFANDAVTNLGQGINMHGSNGGTFDAGLSFGKHGVTNTTFTLSTIDGAPLTLDELAHVDFGVRFGAGGGKATVVAPAAPDAVDDVVTVFEDEAAMLNLLANDTDADPGDVLSVVYTSDPANGAITIPPGGSTVTYVSDHNYSGSDTFTYYISDGNGGKDWATATVNVIAVADAPALDVTVSAGAVNEIKLHVTATVTDDSEFIDRFEFANLPAGVTVIGAPGGVYEIAGTPGTWAADFTLVLEPGQAYDFDLGVKAYSKELSNGDEEAATEIVEVKLETKTTTGNLNFATQDQSIWNTGGEFVLDDHRFLGIDEGFNESLSVGPISASIGASLKTGFQSDLHFEGGDIDAALPYNITINTSYNKTTDVLLIDPSAFMAAGGSFQTFGPEGSYKLDFILNYFLGASVKLDLPLIPTITLFGKEISDENTETIININSNQTFDIPLPFGLTGTVRWPDVDTTSNPGSGTLTSTGASNDFLHLNLDVDQAFADAFLVGVNPFEISLDDIPGVDGTIQLIDLDLFGGLNFVQNFTLQAPNLEGFLVFENDAQIAFNTLSDIELTNAASYDTDDDGLIEFELVLKPDATLQNDTDLGINLGYNFDLLRVTGSYDIEIHSDTFDFAVVDEGGALQVATIDLFNNTFDLNFATQGFAFMA